MLTVDLVKNFDDFLRLKSIWNSILGTSSRNVVCLTHEWFQAWWPAFGEDKKLHILLVRDKNEYLGIAPLMLTKGSYRGLSIRKICFMANGHSPCADFIISTRPKEVVKSVLDYLTENKKSWDLIEFQKLYDGSDSYAYLKAFLDEKRIRYGLKESISSPFIKIDSDWETFLSKRSRKFRKVLRNKVNRIKRAGDVCIERISDRESIELNLPVIFDITSRTWKAQEKISIPDNPQSAMFYKEITKIMGNKGWVDLWLMKKNSETIAFEYHLKYNCTTYPIRAAFCDKYHEISPGTMLEYNILRSLFQDTQIREYNSCGHTYQYLLNWTRDIRKHINLEVFNSTMLPRFLFSFEYRVLPLLRKIGLNKLKKVLVFKNGE